MKKFSFYATALSVAISSCALTSCVDDDESDEVLAIRKATVREAEAEATEAEMDAYSATISANDAFYASYKQFEADLLTLKGDLETAQKDMDDLKDGTKSLEALKAEKISQENVKIASKQAEIEVWQKYSSTTSESALADYNAAKEDAAVLATEKAEATEASTLAKANYDNLKKELAVMKNSSDVSTDATPYALVKAARALKKIEATLIEEKEVKFGNELANESYKVIVLETGIAKSWVKTQTDAIGDNTSGQVYNVKSLRDAANAETDAINKASLQVDLAQAQAKLEIMQEELTNFNALLAVFDEEGEAYKAYAAAVENLEKLYVAKEDAAVALTVATAKSSAAESVATALKTTSESVTSTKTFVDAINTAEEAIIASQKTIAELQNEVTDNATAIKFFESKIAEYNKEISTAETLIAKYRSIIGGSSSNNTPAPEPAAE